MMRTTITLDKDVAAAIARLRKARDETLKDLINEALREGLKHLAAPHRKRAPFRTGAVELGRCLVGSVDDVAELMAVTDSESFR